MTSIDKIKFKLLSDKEINKMAVVEIYNKNIHDSENRKPLAHGPLDLRLGLSTSENVCGTCKENLQECPGHWGKIKLALPCFHIALLKETISLLNCICKKCSAILIKQDEIVEDVETIKEMCKKQKNCHICKALQGTVKKNNAFRLFHEFKHKNTFFCEELNPLAVLNLFRNISINDLSILGISDPTAYLIQTLLVPPSCIRPSVDMQEEGFNEDDLTVKLAEIVNCNTIIFENINKGNSLNSINDDWDYLQLQIGLYINSDLPNINVSNVTPIKSLIHRIKGKQGRFRMNLSGKRVDFSGRTVISPDPNLSIEEVGMPEEIARELTIPEKVTSFNIENLNKLILENKANYVIRNRNGKTFKVYLKYAKNKSIAVGDIVERQLMNGDIVLFNRQPSLHRMSIMAHKVKIHKHRTLRFNEAVCNPYNADFDGDEMNIHVPQTKEAQAEAELLMATSSNICTVKNNEPLISPTQDFITGIFLLSRDNVYLTKNEYFDLVAHFIEFDKVFKIKPCIETESVKLYSGRQVIDAMLLFSDDISFTAKNRKNDEVIFYRSTFIKGELDKAIIGAENRKGSIIYKILEINRKECVKFINNIARLSSRYLMNRGLSIGLDDVTMTEEVKNKKSEVFSSVMKQIVAESENEPLKRSLLNKIREECGNFCLKSLSKYNGPVIMSECGSKGSKINVGQMVACVGQQIVQGERIQNGMIGRTLPHMKEGLVDDIFYRGFVFNSFYTGLRANEFFFHAVSGREGLVDTAVKTAETGYMQRRLMKALEDLSVKYDGTVRNSFNEIVQFIYGEDGKDILKLNKIEAGTAVGAMSAQSIGEPGTQMTLKTFHFAGVASMNITQGVPRLKEIINATISISTPVITIRNVDLYSATKIKEIVEKVYLRDIVKELMIDVEEEHKYKTENRLTLHLTIKTIKVIDDHNLSQLSIQKIDDYTYLHKVKYVEFKTNKIVTSLLDRQISGYKECNEVVIKENSNGLYTLLISSNGGYSKVLGTELVNYRETYTNNILEAATVLGIEAARELIILEIEKTMASHGIHIDPRHLMLLADTMTACGVVSGITRFGMKLGKNSTLMLASFEQSADFLFNAAITQKEERVKGVSECIILGKKINVGTGIVEIIK